MSPQRKGSRRGTGWKPPRDRREVVIAVLASLAVIIVTASLVWVLRPNRDSGTLVGARHGGDLDDRARRRGHDRPRRDHHHGAAHQRAGDLDALSGSGPRPRRPSKPGAGSPSTSSSGDALDALDAGDSVLVAAPTGSGKTLVAEYAIERALAGGGKVFYTTPLKALSNQKYGDLVARARTRARSGLLTGDNSVNGDAPIVVMTTEVLRNMIYAASPALDGLQYVVLDEVHYLQDRYRGPVWEEVIVHLAARGRPGVPLGDGVERRGGRGLDRDGARAAPRPSSRSTAR